MKKYNPKMPKEITIYKVDLGDVMGEMLTFVKPSNPDVPFKSCQYVLVKNDK